MSPSCHASVQGLSQNLATARTAHAMSGRAIVAVHMSAPTASRYGNFDKSSFSSGVGDLSGFERVGTREEPGVLLVSTPNFSTIDFILKFLPSLAVNISIVAWSWHGQGCRPRARPPPSSFSVIDLAEHAGIRFSILESDRRHVVAEFVSVSSRLFKSVGRLVQHPHCPEKLSILLGNFNVYLLINPHL